MYIPISEDSVSAYERGIRQPSLDTLSKIADLYQTSTDYLLGRTDIEVPYPKTLQEMEGVTSSLVNEVINKIIQTGGDHIDGQNITRRSD